MFNQKPALREEEDEEEEEEEEEAEPAPVSAPAAASPWRLAVKLLCGVIGHPDLSGRFGNSQRWPVSTP